MLTFFNLLAFLNHKQVGSMYITCGIFGIQGTLKAFQSYQCKILKKKAKTKQKKLTSLQETRALSRAFVS